MKEQYSPGEIISSGLCIGCGSCAAQASANGMHARMEFDRYGQYKPVFSPGFMNFKYLWFSRTCPFSPSSMNEDQLSEGFFEETGETDKSIGRYMSCYAGYVSEEGFRINGSSGGMTSWLATELMKRELIDGVGHVVPVNDPEKDSKFFRYRISRTTGEIAEGAKSRYYPVEMSEVLGTIMGTPGRYAIIAVPCMIKAVQLLRMYDPVLHDRIRYTLGLFCGHMKSARLVESFAWQMRVPFRNVGYVDFRQKLPGRPASWYNAALKLKGNHFVNKDWWHLADGDWGAGYFMNNACNFCDDVVAETADISFGDAWTEPYASDGRGTNAVIVRSLEIDEIVNTGIKEGRLSLERKDAVFVTGTQAAGFRHRREGLAYRLSWITPAVKPAKRVFPDGKKLPGTRKKIYRIRYYISEWSHRVFRFASVIRIPFIYIMWARIMTSVYHGIAYHNGKLSEMIKRYDAIRH